MLKDLLFSPAPFNTTGITGSLSLNSTTFTTVTGTSRVTVFLKTLNNFKIATPGYHNRYPSQGVAQILVIEYDSVLHQPTVLMQYYRTTRTIFPTTDFRHHIFKTQTSASISRCFLCKFQCIISINYSTT